MEAVEEILFIGGSCIVRREACTAFAGWNTTFYLSIKRENCSRPRQSGGSPRPEPHSHKALPYRRAAIYFCEAEALGGRFRDKPAAIG